MNGGREVLREIGKRGQGEMEGLGEIKKKKDRKREVVGGERNLGVAD